MFLVDSALAARDWEGINKTIKNILKKAKAEIVSIDKWDERKLAYDIKGQSRGTYILCYFKVDGQKIGEIERDAKLSEKIMRVLILNAEHMTEEDIRKATSSSEKEKRGEEAAWTKRRVQKKPAKPAEDKQAEREKFAETEEEQKEETAEKTNEAESVE
jgi:small subunit ribosomal protein S6